MTIVMTIAIAIRIVIVWAIDMDTYLDEVTDAKP